MTSGPPRQLTFDLPLGAATEAGDFLVSAGNAGAVELVNGWPNWPHPSALLVGPRASGKSHLASVWQQRSGAHNVAAAAISDATVELFSSPAVHALVIEDIDRGIASETVLFHLLNVARETKRWCLLTSASPPVDLGIALPDLRSRLTALPVMTIAMPDDALLGSVLVKLFADRQLVVEPQVVSFLVRRIDRSLEAARSAVAAIDALALARQRKVTRAIAAEAINALDSGADPHDDVP